MIQEFEQDDKVWRILEFVEELPTQIVPMLWNPNWENSLYLHTLAGGYHLFWVNPVLYYHKWKLDSNKK